MSTNDAFSLSLVRISSALLCALHPQTPHKVKSSLGRGLVLLDTVLTGTYSYLFQEGKC
jgi:hypothetical protein